MNQVNQVILLRQTLNQYWDGMVQGLIF